MPGHTLSSSISSTKIFPKFLLPIEEFTLHQRRKLEGALQLHFTTEIMLKVLSFCSVVKCSFLCLIAYQTTLSWLEGKNNHPSYFSSQAFCKAILHMLLHSQSVVPTAPRGTEKIFLTMQHLPLWGVETQSQKIKD